MIFVKNLVSEKSICFWVFPILFLFFQPVGILAKGLNSDKIFLLSYQQSKLNKLEEADRQNYLINQSGFELKDDLEAGGDMKSKSKAMLLSFFLPGSGHLYAQSNTKGKIFLGVEAGLWLGFFAFRTYGSWLKNDYKNYSALHAGVILEGKYDNEDFFEDVAAYQSRDEYNQFVKFYEESDSPLYPETDFWNWEWDNQSSLKEYREIRNRKRSAYRRSLYMVGLSLANRLLSAIDAVREVKKFNRKKIFGDSFSNFRLSVNPLGHNPSIKLMFTKSF